MLQALPHIFSGFAVDLLRLGVWLVILAAIFVPLERLFALRPDKIWRTGVGPDLGYYFFSGLVASMLLSFPLGAVAWATHRFVPYPLQSVFSGLSFWPRALVALVVGEIGFYWGHRLMHEVPLLWRFHAIHHSPERLDFLVNSRAHPVDLAFGRLCGIVPLYVLGLAQPSIAGGSLIPVLVVLVERIWGYFIHANVRWRLRALTWIVSTPEFHHWHHAMEPANRNYTSTLPLLDWIFGTLHLPSGQWPPNYGIRGKVPASWLGQLIQPLRGPFPPQQTEYMPPVLPPAEISH